MNKLLLPLFCLFSLTIFVYAVEFDEENSGNRHAYNLNALFTKSLSRLARSQSLKDEYPNLILDLNLNGFDPDADLNGTSLQNSSKCLDDILYILLNIKNQWAIKVIDSIGKPESGILQGHFKWVGDYNECISVQSTNPNSTVGNFHGKYCTLTTSLQLNTSMPLNLGIGVCVPDSCTAAELQNYLQFSHIPGYVPVLNGTKSKPKASITCKPTERHLNSPAKAVIALLSIFCTLAVVGSSITVVKYFKEIIEGSKDLSFDANILETDHVFAGDSSLKRINADSVEKSLLKDYESPSSTKVFLDKLQAFLGCFCVFTNGAKLLNTDSSEGQLLCIHGVRFLSMSWVILGHSYLFGYTTIGNIVEAASSLDNFAFQVVLQGFYSVDSFFLISGFLLAYLSMKEFSKTGGIIAWPYFYIHRYIRLTPIYMMVLAFSATLYLYIGSGPYWPNGDLDPNCKESWWWNLLYINNFKSQSTMCMGWSWYLANDMQFFVISPLFLICLWRWPKIGYGLLATFLCGTFIANFVITYHYELPAGMTAMVGTAGISDFSQLTLKYLEYFDKIYIKPYTRIGPYLIGILLGHLLFKHKENNKHGHSWVFLCVGWIVATIVTLACVYGLYHAHPKVVASSFYNALNRSCFAAGLSWVIYVCLIGQGGAVNSILSYKLFIPLSRLTYAAYLIHPMIINGYFGSLKKSLDFSHPTVVLIFFGTMLVTYGLSLPVALILESPIVSLEKLIRKSFSRKENN